MKAREDLGNCKICLNLICLHTEGVYAFALTPYTRGGRDVPNAHNIEEDCEGSMFAELAG